LTEAMQQSFKILVVDDEPAIRDVLREYFETIDKKYSVLTCKDGFEALGVIQNQSIDCCFTDLSMPRMDGLELTEKIHTHDNSIPVVVMTGYPSMESAIKTLRNGVVDFLVKPIRMEKLPMVLERAIRERTLLVENVLLKEEAKGQEKLLKINQELQGKIKELEAVNLILKRLDEPASSKDFFHTLVNFSGQLTHCDEAHFCVVDQKLESPTLIASFVKEGKVRAPFQQLLGPEMIKKVAEGAMPVIIKGSEGKSQVIAMPLRIRGMIFGMLILATGNGNPDFTEKDLYFLNVLGEKASSSIENLALYENIHQNLFSTLYAFVEAIEARDVYTKQHSARVTRYSVIMAKAIGCSEEQMQVLNVAGYLHDIGKIGIPDQILLKPGKLTDEEYQVIKRHPIIGSSIIGHFSMWIEEQKIIRCHHERWDGKGYPDGLTHQEIPFLSRVVALSDVYDALTSDRSYRRKLSEEAAIAIIKENSGSQFDPEVVTVFMDLIRQGKISSDEREHPSGISDDKDKSEPSKVLDQGGRKT
jgi:putative nucleotidyltransferase with HDIG domain